MPRIRSGISQCGNCHLDRGPPAGCRQFLLQPSVAADRTNRLYISKGTVKQKGCPTTGQDLCSHPPVRPYGSGAKIKITSLCKLVRAVCSLLPHLQLSWFCPKFVSLFLEQWLFLIPRLCLSHFVSAFSLSLLPSPHSSLLSPFSACISLGYSLSNLLLPLYPQHAPEHRSWPASAVIPCCRCSAPHGISQMRNSCFGCSVGVWASSDEKSCNL